MTTKHECPKCKSRMEPGLLIDHTHHGLRTRQTWIAGEMKEGWLGREKMPSGRVENVTTWRCTSCGYLESYAEG